MADDFYESDYYLEIVQQRLQKYFTIARQQYYPRWDSAQEWRIVPKRRKGTGYCSSKEKRIYIDPRGIRDMLDDGLLALIIHEICHDVATAFHTERWMERMEKAAKKAESLGQSEVACLIRASAFSNISSDKPWCEKWCRYFSPLIY